MCIRDRFITGVLHKSITLSYRTLIWDAAIKNILSKPIVGYGTCRGQLMLINSVQIHGRNILYFSHNYLLENMIQGGILAVSYTHLDVYKRQAHRTALSKQQQLK